MPLCDAVIRKAIGTKMMQWWCNTQVWYHCQQK